MVEGTIFKSLSGFYYVETENGTVRCEARGRFRHLGIKPLVGDRVEITETESGRGMVDKILPRRNSFSRPLIANVDQLVFVTSETVPVTDTLVLDRMIAMAEAADVEPVICVNKCDLSDATRLYDIYSAAGFAVFCVSAATGDGVDELRCRLAGRISAFAGDSGVGKSSLLNLLLPDAPLETGDVSTKLGRGRHTTRHVELYKIPNGGLVADTPGFASVGEEMLDEDAEKLQLYFREFKPYTDDCRFVGCAHIKENGCAVLRAVADGKIPETRHKNYVKLYEEAKQKASWERKK